MCVQGCHSAQRVSENLTRAHDALSHGQVPTANFGHPARPVPICDAAARRWPCPTNLRKSAVSYKSTEERRALLYILHVAESALTSPSPSPTTPSHWLLASF